MWLHEDTECVCHVHTYIYGSNAAPDTQYVLNIYLLNGMDKIN